MGSSARSQSLASSQSSTGLSFRPFSLSSFGDNSPTSTPLPSSVLSTSTSSTDQSVLRSTGVPHLGGFFGGREAFAVPFIVACFLLLILLAISTTMCCLRCRRKSFYSATDEHTLGYMGSGSSPQEFTKEWSGVRDETWCDTKHPHLAGIPKHRDQDRQVYRPTLQPLVNDIGPKTSNRSMTITSQSRAHLRFPNWRRLSRVPSSPPIHLITLSVEGDDDPVRQLPTPPSIARPKTTAGPYQSDSYDASASAKEPDLSGVPEPYLMVPAEYYQGCGDVSVMNQPRDGLRQSCLLPDPPGSPLRGTL